MTSSNEPAALPEGWYDDPDDPTQWRYWGGRTWTEHRAPKQAPQPAARPSATDDKPTWRRLWPVVAILVVVTIIALGQSGPLAEFDRALEDGASCGRLYDLRNELHPREDAEAVAEANRKLRAVGCTSSMSERTDR